MGDWEGIEKPITAETTRFRKGQRVKYVPNHPSFGAFMRSDQMRDVTAEVAQDIAVAAAANAPAPTEDTDKKKRGPALYRVRRNAGQINVAGNMRVKVEVVGQSRAVERAEFGHSDGGRNRNLAETGSQFGDWKPSD